MTKYVIKRILLMFLTLIIILTIVAARMMHREAKMDQPI